jgi:hypothetical protein
MTDTPQPIPPQIIPPDAPKTSRDVKCFASFAEASTMTDVVRKCGIPDEHQGSGIYIFIYDMNDGSVVAVGTADLNHLMYVSHITDRGSRSLFSRAPTDAKSIQVPERVAILVRPILDELQKYQRDGGTDRHVVDERFYDLTKKKSPSADEALVVLMCFEIMGESQEDADAVIARGRRMLPFAEKYRVGDPKIPGRSYPHTMLKSASHKTGDFQGTVKAIKHGWRGTWDNPEG